MWFTKKQYIGGATRTTTARAYRTVIDWEAVGGAIVIVFIVFAALGSLGG